MKITIDTKEDSHSEIEKAIKLLKSLIEASSSNSNIFSDDNIKTNTESSSSGSIFNMFGDDTPMPKPSEVISHPNPSEVEEEEDIPQIMEY